MVCRMDDGKNLILLRTAIFLVKDFNRLLVCSCQKRLLSIVNPKHFHHDLNSINNLLNLNHHEKLFFPILQMRQWTNESLIR